MISVFFLNLLQFKLNHGARENIAKLTRTMMQPLTKTQTGLVILVVTVVSLVLLVSEFGLFNLTNFGSPVKQVRGFYQNGSYDRNFMNLFDQNLLDLERSILLKYVESNELSIEDEDRHIFQLFKFFDFIKDGRCDHIYLDFGTNFGVQIRNHIKKLGFLLSF